MLSYFGLIAAASLFITIEFVYAIRTAAPSPAVLSAMSTQAQESMAEVVKDLHGLRDKAVLMCGVQAVVTLIVLIMFMRRITGPLQHMVETARLISEGDLSKTVRIRTGDEIGRLGETINGLAGNIQEIVAYGLSTQASVKEAVERLRPMLPDHGSEVECLNEMDAAVAGFEDILTGFKLFPAPAADGEEGSLDPL
jgi:methyl-accepting chemotaxis protein